jgi:hypothetical protein
MSMPGGEAVRSASKVCPTAGDSISDLSFCEFRGLCVSRGCLRLAFACSVFISYYGLATNAGGDTFYDRRAGCGSATGSEGGLRLSSFGKK